MNVIGLMSGTSVDGVDAALVEISGAPPNLSVREIALLTQPYDEATRTAVLALCRPDAPLLALGRVRILLGHRFAEAALAVIAQAGVAPTALAIIGSHGQTVYHAPDGDLPFTLQIGDPAIITARTGLPTVADFRAADVAAGGQGAPLVPYPDWLMWHHPTHTRALQNIGGIANVTCLPSGGGPESIVAFDTGPGNVLIDGIAARASNGALRCDRNGALAAQGKVDEMLLSHLLDHPYLRQPPPKSTGRETFGAAFAADLWAQAEASGQDPADLVATVTAFTAASIADAYRRWLPILPDEVFLCGGGADNPTLVQMIREYLARAFGGAVPAVRHYDETGYSSAAKEAVAFAILAYETWHGRPGNLPQVTGASRPAILGHVSCPLHPHIPWVAGRGTIEPAEK
jgi:anhydro-N-acetylmuramic acid kinase